MRGEECSGVEWVSTSTRSKENSHRVIVADDVGVLHPVNVLLLAMDRLVQLILYADRRQVLVEILCKSSNNWNVCFSIFVVVGFCLLHCVFDTFIH